MNRVMTDKEKAIEALNGIKYFEESWYADLFPIIEKQLYQPTLDDAIAVVEKIASTNIDQYFNYDKLIAYEDILTALKVLKEGK